MAETTSSAYPVALGLLKASLGYYGSTLDSAVETYLTQLLEYAETALAERDIVLDPEDIYDATLQAMYAGWLYRKSRTGEGKPEMLKSEIRDRQVKNALRSAAKDGGADT